MPSHPFEWMIWLVNLPTQELKWINNEFRKRQVGLLQLKHDNFAFQLCVCDVECKNGSICRNITKFNK